MSSTYMYGDYFEKKNVFRLKWLTFFVAPEDIINMRISPKGANVAMVWNAMIFLNTDDVFTWT